LSIFYVPDTILVPGLTMINRTKTLAERNQTLIQITLLWIDQNTCPNGSSPGTQTRRVRSSWRGWVVSKIFVGVVAFLWTWTDRRNFPPWP
jgi:hypothetical protein